MKSPVGVLARIPFTNDYKKELSEVLLSGHLSISH